MGLVKKIDSGISIALRNDKIHTRFVIYVIKIVYFEAADWRV